jgi:hypothetical protein
VRLIKNPFLDLGQRMDMSPSGLAVVDQRSLSLDSEISSLKRALAECEVYTQSSDERSMLKTAEDRLHDLVVRFNHLINLNESAKAEIEVLRREKDMFHSIHERMTRELRRITNHMSSVVQKSKADYAARDLALSHIVHLKAQADKEHAEFEKEWKELVCLIENDKRMREFIQQKEMHERKARRAISDKDRFSGHILLTKPFFDDLKAKLVGVQSQFELIKEATGLNTIEELISFFNDKGNKTFSLFRNLAQCTENIGKVAAAIKSVRKDVQEGHGSFAPHIQLGTAGSYASRRTFVEARIEDINCKFFIMQKLLSSLCSIIRSTFDKLFPETHLIEKYMSTRVFAASAVIPIGSVSDSNVIDYLAAIETRVSDLVNLHGNVLPVFCKKSNTTNKSGHRKSLASSQHRIVQASHSMASIVVMKMMQYKLPSSTDDDPNHAHHFEGPDEADRPLSKNEIRARTLEHIKNNSHKAHATRLNVLKPT